MVQKHLHEYQQSRSGAFFQAVGRWSRRGLSIQAGLARIQAASQENAQKILAVQVGDCREVGKIIPI